MLADIDILVGGSSSISFTPSFQFESKVHDYDISSDILSSKNSSLSCGAKNGRLDFAAALSSGSNSGSHLGRSAPTHFTFHGRCSSSTLKPVFSSTTPAAVQTNFDRLKLTPSESSKAMPVVVPRRPCLVVRCDVLNLRTPTKSKKKVVFADDRGFPLTLVRTMTEPSNVPPQLSLRFLAKMAQDDIREEIFETWEVVFPQPASDYLDFRRRLDNNNVSLENVIVKEMDRVILGTVKVRNLVFHKEVFMRKTSNNWKTQEDVYCTYVPNGSSSHYVGVYDTFSFRFDLPPSSNEIEFCVCFRCDGAEYWDNNSGKNYFIIKKDSPTKRLSLGQSASFQSNANGSINLCQNFNDNAKNNVEAESWSESAGLNSLCDCTPYW